MKVDFDELEPSDDYLSLNYRGQPFTGIAFELDQHGKLLSETSYVDGQKEGIAKEWGPAGIVVREQHYANDTRHGHSREWYESGSLKSEAEYELGICLWEREWTNDGQLVRDFMLNEGDPQFATLQKLRASTIGLTIKAHEG